jgi:hypothetical protein
MVGKEHVEIMEVSARSSGQQNIFHGDLTAMMTLHLRFFSGFLLCAESPAGVTVVRGKPCPLAPFELHLIDAAALTRESEGAMDFRGTLVEGASKEPLLVGQFRASYETYRRRTG